MLGKCLSLSHITLYVSNARQAALNYCFQFGFKPYRYRGLESGHRLQASHAVINNNIVLVFMSPLINYQNNALINQHLVKHGDAVKDVAFNVDSIEAVLSRVSNGRNGGEEEAAVMSSQWSERDSYGDVKYATVCAYGDTTHTLIERNGYPHDLFLPGWQLSPLDECLKDSVWSKLPAVNLQHIDHVAANQPIGSMVDTVKWYENNLGFHRYWSADDTQIDTEMTGLRTIFMANEDESIRMPINEPSAKSKKSQIQEYLDYNDGPGVQHIAFHCRNICDTIEKLRSRGVEFLSTPDTYYERLADRINASRLTVKEDLETLRRLKILVDFNETGYLLQIFTKPLQDRPTLFLELIERFNYNGFGARNIKALFEAIEAQQLLRGNL